jgi:DNA-binding beta-propeller fold protein YncE
MRRADSGVGFKPMHPTRMLAAAALAVLATSAFAAPLLELVETINLPSVKGRIDHLDADPANHRIFVAALGDDTVQVVDTRERARGTLRGFSKPQGIAYLPQQNRLVIGNGSAGRVDLIDGTSFAVLKRIEDMPNADNVRHDPAAKKIYVGYGDGALRVIDAATGASEGDIPLPGHPESFQLESEGTRVFVNVPTARSIVVADRATRSRIAVWSTGGAEGNFPMALDEAGRRLFVGTRSPPSIVVHDIDTGKVVARVPIGGDADDLFFDATHGRAYAICGEGRVDVVRREAGDHYSLEGSVETEPGARTGLFVPQQRRLYVAAPASRSGPPRLLVFRVP